MLPRDASGPAEGWDRPPACTARVRCRPPAVPRCSIECSVKTADHGATSWDIKEMPPVAGPGQGGAGPRRRCTMSIAMKQDFSDRATFLKAMTPMREATFYGHDVVYDEASHTMTLTLTRADQSRGGAGGFMAARKQIYIKTLITVRRITSYKQYLAGESADVYVFD